MRAGLTFVELLMAATMFSVLAVGFSAHLRGGLIAWRRASTSTEQVQQVRVALDQLGQDLANALILDAREGAAPSAVFGADQLRFWTAVSEASESGSASPTRRVGMVTYGRTQEGGEGALSRRFQTIREAGAGILPAADIICPHVEAFAIHYAKLPDGTSELEWGSREWPASSPPPQLPKLVQVTLTLRRSSGGSYQVRQVFMIPTGTLKPTEAEEPS